MKILFPVHCYFPSNSDGKAFTIYNLNKELGKIDFKISVVSPKTGLENIQIDKKKSTINITSLLNLLNTLYLVSFH